MKSTNIIFFAKEGRKGKPKRKEWRKEKSRLGHSLKPAGDQLRGGLKENNEV